jgi:hypothetical protein
MLSSCSLWPKASTPPTSPILGDVGSTQLHGSMAEGFPRIINGGTFDNIAYSEADNCYYYFQWNSWNYEVDAYGALTQDILARLNKVSTDDNSHEIISEYPIEGVAINQSEVYYRMGNTIVKKEEGIDRVIVDVDDNKAWLGNCFIEGNYLYYTLKDLNSVGANQPCILRLQLDEPESTPETFFEGSFMDFQIVNGELFYLTDSGVMQYNGKTKTLVLAGQQIDSFLIDGLLLYSDTHKNLYMADKREPIAKDVSAYTIYGDSIYYATSEGLFCYEVSALSMREILTQNVLDTENYKIHSIKVCNNMLFLNMRITNEFVPDSISYLFTATLDGSAYNPFIEIDAEKYQTYTNYEQGYWLEYPIGYILQFDAGSYLSGYALFSDPVSRMTMMVMNRGFYYGHDDTKSTGTKVATGDGTIGYYSIKTDGDVFTISCTTENDFTIVFKGYVDSLKNAESIFLNVLASLHIT